MTYDQIAKKISEMKPEERKQEAKVILPNEKEGRIIGFCWEEVVAFMRVHYS